MFAELAADGHQVTVEYDSAEKREQLQDETNLGMLEAGWKMAVEGAEIRTPEEYRQWKRARNKGPGQAPPVSETTAKG